MAKRHVLHHEAWSEHTKKLAGLQQGDKVFIQNQVGPNPRKWERTGTVVECKDHDQYAVKVDGTGRVTLRNRKFLRLLKQIPKYPPSSSPPASVSVTPTLPTHEPETGETQETLQGTTFPPTCTPSVVPDQLCDPGTYHTFPSTPAHTASHPTSPVQSVTRPTSTSASPNIPTPVVDTVPASPAPVTRPQRTRRPNTLFNPETWDLSGLEEDSFLTRRQVSDLFLLIAQKIDKGL